MAMYHFRLKSDRKPDGTKISASNHADYIYREGAFSNIEQTKVQASSHLDYMNRDTVFANCGDCIFHSHHLPKWAQDDPKKFFKAADKYESYGNRRYIEIEFAIPNELYTIEEYRQIIDSFILKHLSDYYFAYAIHDKIGVLSDGQCHPHVHIMFSERLIDDVKKRKKGLLVTFSNILRERKKTVVRLLLKNVENTVHLNLVFGLLALFFTPFALISLRSCLHKKIW